MFDLFFLFFVGVSDCFFFFSTLGFLYFFICAVLVFGNYAFGDLLYVFFYSYFYVFSLSFYFSFEADDEVGDFISDSCEVLCQVSFFFYSGKYFVVCLSYVFFIIFFGNLLGTCVPSLTLFAQFFSTFFFGFVIYFGIQFLLFRLYMFYFMKLFIPVNSFTVLLFFFFVVEFLSYVCRLLSIFIRLFSNLTAGHILMEIFCSFFCIFVLSIVSF